MYPLDHLSLICVSHSLDTNRQFYTCGTLTSLFRVIDEDTKEKFTEQSIIESKVDKKIFSNVSPRYQLFSKKRKKRRREDKKKNKKSAKRYKEKIRELVVESQIKSLRLGKGNKDSRTSIGDRIIESCIHLKPPSDGLNLGL